ncbi:hypothetical protein CIPAW_13G179300 [Carya illinoinensis]|uniref:Uncharacterized protein n=1 Tax=Carya illinoinensis TaxID=32201 RepID=A0A8T1NQP6_CARIL|nr:hypothetical protein CIPAW_13G179300 [Carya illinoinensis]
MWYLHNHLPNKALLNVRKLHIPKPPFGIGEQILFQLTRWNFVSSLIPPHKKARNSLSILVVTPACKGKSERKKVGRLVKELLIKVSRPPFDRYICFHPTSFLSTLSTTPSQLA